MERWENGQVLTVNSSDFHYNKEIISCFITKRKVWIEEEKKLKDPRPKWLIPMVDSARLPYQRRVSLKKIRQIRLRKGSKESLFGPTLAFYRLKRRAFLIAFQLSTVFFGPAFFTSWSLSPFYVCNYQKSDFFSWRHDC